MLEITMSIKCGNCISHQSFVYQRNEDGELDFALTINSHHYRKFTARQSFPDTAFVKCEECGHEEAVTI